MREKITHIGFKKSFYQISQEIIGQIFYFLFFFLCSTSAPVYSSPILIAQIAQTQKSLKNTDSLTNPSFLKNSESTDHQLPPLEYKYLQMVKDSSGRPVTNNAHQPRFVWTKTLEQPVVHLPQHSKKDSFQLIEKRHSKKVVYSTCKIASFYLTWKLVQYLNQKYFCWPTMPKTFQKKIQDRLSLSSDIQKGHYTYKEYFTDSLMKFIYIPLDKKTTKYKICKILEKPNFFLDQLSFFCECPRIWVEKINDRSDTDTRYGAIYKEFRDDLIRLSRECSDLSSAYKNSDPTFYYERNLFEITSNFDGNPGFFDFIFGKIVLKFWQITWDKSLYNE